MGLVRPELTKRALASFDIFSEDSAGRFALAPMGEFLKRDMPGSLHTAALFFGGEDGAGAVRLFLECVKTGETVPQKLSGLSCFDWLLSDPERTKLFNAMMTAFATLHFTGVKHMTFRAPPKLLTWVEVMER